MKTIKYWAVSLLLLLSWPLAAQDQPAIVKLTVKHNGKIVHSPREIILSVPGDFSIQLPLKEGTFEIPPEILKKNLKVVEFSTVVGRDRIHTTMLGDHLIVSHWTIVLADKRFSDDYGPITQGANPRASCIVEYDPTGAEGTEMFAENCRSRIPKGESK